MMLAIVLSGYNTTAKLEGQTSDGTIGEHVTNLTRHVEDRRDVWEQRGCMKSRGAMDKNGSMVADAGTSRDWRLVWVQEG